MYARETVWLVPWNAARLIDISRSGQGIRSSHQQEVLAAPLITTEVRLKITTARKCACVVTPLLCVRNSRKRALKQVSGLPCLPVTPPQADVTFAPMSSIPISLPGLSLNGWNGSLEFRFLRFLGVVGDVSGHYGSYGATLGCEAIVVCVPLGVNVNSNLYTFLVGPQVSVSLWRFTPFAHVLLGVAHINHDNEHHVRQRAGE